MEQSMELNKRRRGRPKKVATLSPAELLAEKIMNQNPEVEEVEDVTASMESMRDAALVVQEEAHVAPKRVGRMTDDERSRPDVQKTSMQLLAGEILTHFKSCVKNKELDFNQELQLFKTIAPYLGYDKEGNKTAEDVGMDMFAMRYLEITARVKTVEEKSRPIILDK